MRGVRAESGHLSSLISRTEPAPTRSSTGSNRNYSSRPDRIGREGLLDLEFIRRDGETILARRRFTHPLQALEPVRASDGTLYLMMLNTSGGMVGGDRLRTTVEFGPDTAAALLTASAGKAYRSNGAPAIQETYIRLNRGSTLEYLPDHLIPHPGAVVRQSLRIEMAAKSRAIICDAIAAGRIGRGERWAFRELDIETVVMLGARPLYINRARIIPALQPLDQLGWAQDFNYLAGIVVVGACAEDGSAYHWPALSDAIDAELRERTSILGGVSELEGGGIAVRFMTYRAIELTLVTRTLWSIARRFLLGREAFECRKF